MSDLIERLKQQVFDSECDGNLIEEAVESIERHMEAYRSMRILIIDLQATLKSSTRSGSSMLDQCDSERKRLGI